MFKKLIGLGIAVVLLFSFAGCNNPADDFNLEEYKVEARTELNSYVLGLDENDYSEENWQIIEGIVESAKDDIDAAKDKSTVDAAKEDAIQAIDAVPQKGEMGKFYTLQKAYDESLLTVEDLQSMLQHYVNNDLDPEQLSLEVATAIKEAWAKALRNRDMIPEPEATADDVTIFGYFGTYNECVAVRVHDRFSGYADVEYEEVVAGVTFVLSGPSILIWKEI